MTKAESKKMETEKRYDFIARVYETVLNCIPAETRGYRKKVEVRIAHQNYSRYVRFHAYGQDLAFQIYGDGNIVIELKEACHNDHVEQIFEYDTDTGAQETFIAELAKLAPVLIRVFIDKAAPDFHTLMDYVAYENTINAAVQKMQAEFSGLN